MDKCQWITPSALKLKEHIIHKHTQVTLRSMTDFTVSAHSSATTTLSPGSSSGSPHNDSLDTQRLLSETHFQTTPALPQFIEPQHSSPSATHFQTTSTPPQSIEQQYSSPSAMSQDSLLESTAILSPLLLFSEIENNFMDVDNCMNSLFLT